MAAAISCKKESSDLHQEGGQEIASHKVPKTIYGRNVESHESTRQQVPSSLLTKHEDRIAGKKFTSKGHCNLIHIISYVPGDANSDVKAVVDKEWKKLETISAWQMEKVTSKKELFLEAQKKTKIKFTLLHWMYVIFPKR